MDGKQFDRIALGLTREGPRRQLLGGLFGGALALLAGAGISEAKPGKRQRRRRRRRGGGGRNGSEDATGEVILPPGTLAGGVWDETIQICHFDPEKGKYRITDVPTVTVPEYLNAGDTLYIDCCVDADCTGLACYTSSGCIEGACAYDPTPGVSCTLGDGAYGVCDDEGTCVASSSPPPAPATTTEAPLVAQEAPPPTTGEAAPVSTGEAPPVITDEAPPVTGEAATAQETAPVTTDDTLLAYEAPIIATSAIPVSQSEPVG